MAFKGHHSMSELRLASGHFVEKYSTKVIMANEKSYKFLSNFFCRNISRRIL